MTDLVPLKKINTVLREIFKALFPPPNNRNFALLGMSMHIAFVFAVSLAMFVEYFAWRIANPRKR